MWNKHKNSKQEIIRCQNLNQELICPMNSVFNMDIPSIENNTKTIPISDFFVQHKDKSTKKMSKKIERLIEKYSLEILNYNTDEDDEEKYILLENNFEQLVEDIRRTTIPDKYVYIFSWLLDKAFVITADMKFDTREETTRIHKNKSLLLKVLYEVNKNALFACFSGTLDKM